MFVFLSGEAPEIDHTIPYRQVPEGERAKLICRVRGSPKPFLTWYRKGKLLEVGTLERWAKRVLMRNVVKIIERARLN